MKSTYSRKVRTPPPGLSPSLADAALASSPLDLAELTLRVEVPPYLHQQFVRQLGGDPETAERTLSAFYRSVLGGIPMDTPIGDPPKQFWQAHFSARFPNQRPMPGNATSAGQGNGHSTRVNTSGSDPWSAILRLLEPQLTRHDFHTWFADSRLRLVTEATLIVDVQTAYHRNWIEKHYRDQVATAAAEVRPGSVVQFQARRAES